MTRSDAELDHHWRPQSAFFDDLSVFSHVGCVERLPDALALLGAKRHWRFDFDTAALRNALPRAMLPAAPYASMAPRELASLPGFPSAAQMFNDELRELVARRYADDLRAHREAMGSDAEPFYPTGGALAYHRQPTGTPPVPAAPPAAAAPPAPRAAPPEGSPTPHPDDGPQTLHAAPDGAPDADGSARAPLPLGLALKQAFALQGQGTAVRVWLHDGVYCGNWRVKGQADATAPLTIEAAPNGCPVLCGSDVWTGWTASGANHQHPWPLAWEAMPAPADHGNTWMTAPPLMLRREMVYAGGVRLRQVLDAAELVPGSFHVDAEAAVLSLQAPAGVDIAAVQVDVAVRQQLLEISGAAHLTLRGIGFQHDAGGCFDPAAGALRLSNCQHVLIEDCRARDNNFRGITIRGSRDVTLRRVAMNQNGAVGLLLSRVQRLLLEDCETSSNNWRGAWPGF